MAGEKGERPPVKEGIIEMFSRDSFRSTQTLNDVLKRLEEMRRQVRRYIEGRNEVLNTINLYDLRCLVKGEYLYDAQFVGNFYEQAQKTGGEADIAANRLSFGKIGIKKYESLDRKSIKYEDKYRVAKEKFDGRYEGVIEKLNILDSDIKAYNLGSFYDTVMELLNMNPEEIAHSGILHGLTDSFGLRDAVKRILNIK